MKKLLSHALLFGALVISATGCLKDKGFDNHEYGINDPDKSPSGVGFVLGINAKNSRAIEVGPNQLIKDITINFEGGTAPSQDVHITLVADPTIGALRRSRSPRCRRPGRRACSRRGSAISAGY